MPSRSWDDAWFYANGRGGELLHIDEMKEYFFQFASMIQGDYWVPVHRGATKRRDDRNRDWIHFGNSTVAKEGESYCDKFKHFPIWSDNAFSPIRQIVPTWNFFVIYQPKARKHEEKIK